MSKLFKSPAENVLKEFPDPLINVTPKHQLWDKRVQVEVKNLIEYIEYLKQKEGQLWFFLKPTSNKKYDYKRWDGNMYVPSQPDIKFDIRVVLPSEYPLVYPVAFAEKSIMDYCAGHIYPHNIWIDEEDRTREFIMICHDHMKEQERAWDPHLSIAHFMIREIHVWWMSKVNTVIREWNLKKL